MDKNSEAREYRSGAQKRAMTRLDLLLDIRYDIRRLFTTPGAHPEEALELLRKFDREITSHLESL